MAAAGAAAIPSPLPPVDPLCQARFSHAGSLLSPLESGTLWPWPESESMLEVSKPAVRRIRIAAHGRSLSFVGSHLHGFAS